METVELALKMPEPEISPDQIQRLLAVLFALSETPPPLEPGERPRQPGWFTAAEIASRIGDVTDRHVRKVASAARPAVVSYPGSPGYKLWQHCSIEEISHCIDSFDSQVRDMVKGSLLYRRAYHKRFRGAPGQTIAVQAP